MSDVIANQPVVIDNGSGIIKAGFAGGDRPRVVFPSYVGRPKHVRVMPGVGFDGSDSFVGNKVQDHLGLFKLSYPMEHGVVRDWRDMEKIWGHIYSKEHLNVPSEEHPVLLTEAPLNPYFNRVKAAEIFFETFNVPAMYFSIQAVLSLYASGRTTGVVLDSGDGVTHCVPVYEGFALPHAIGRLDLAGRDVTQRLQHLLRRTGVNFTSSAELQTVRRMKEELCYVAVNPEQEERNSSSSSSGLGWGKSGSSSSAAAAAAAAGSSEMFQLPDGSKISVGAERFRAPEMLFNPHLVGSESRGVGELLLSSVQACDLDLRRQLYGNMVLAGGTTQLRGFGERLLREVSAGAGGETGVRISAPPDRTHSTWAGGSILASLATFKTMWIRREEYIEDPNIVHQKSL